MRASTALKLFSFACLILILLVYVVPLYAMFEDLNSRKFSFNVTNVKVERSEGGYLVNVTLEIKDVGSTYLSGVVILAIFNASGEKKVAKFDIGEVKPVMIRNYTSSFTVGNVTKIEFEELVVKMKIGGLLPVVMKFEKPPEKSS